MNTSFPARILEGDCHWTLKCLAFSGDESFGVGWTRQAEKESRSHVHKQDAPEDLSDSQRDRDSRVLGLGGGNSDRFTARVKCGTEYEDRRNAAEAAGESSWIMPVLEAYAGNALYTARCINDGEQEVGDKAAEFDKSEPELSFTEGLNAEELEAEKSKLQCVNKSLDELRLIGGRRRTADRLELTHSKRKYPHNGTLSLQNTKMLDMALYSFASTANPV